MPNPRGAGRKPVISDDKIRELYDRYQAGESVASLALESGISRQALYKRFDELMESKPEVYDYCIDGELCTRIFIDKRHESLQILNYVGELSKRAFGWNESPDFGDLAKLLECDYFKRKGIDDVNSSDKLLCMESRNNSFVLEVNLPRFEFSKKDIIIARTDTDGFQLKAMSHDRRFFVKSQAIIGGNRMEDWAVEIIASDICKKLEIPVVIQKHCCFVYNGITYDGVYSRNFELDGYTFVSFESLLERSNKSSNSEEFIGLSSIEKLKWCANILSELGGIEYEFCEKYMLDLAILDCLVGNIDRHTRNFGLFYNINEGSFEIPLIFDNGMGLFENDYYRDNYDSFSSAMNNVYILPYGEDPFEFFEILSKEFDLKKLYPNISDITYLDILDKPFVLEYERRMTELCQRLDG